MLLNPAPAESKPRTLRRLMAEKTLTLPGAFNAPVAMLAERTGFEAVYISGAGLANGTAGYPDVGLLGMDEMARQAGYIANAVQVPCICDADTGFGEIWQVMRTVRTYEREGLAGLHLEDQVMPKRCGHLDGKALIGVEEMERKIAAACAARQDPDFVIIARCDARAVEGFEQSVERGRRYLAAGADAIFPEAMQSAEEFARYAEASQRPAPRQHDRIRQIAVPIGRGVRRHGLPPRDFPYERVPHHDEGRRRAVPRTQGKGHFRRCPRTDADARRTLRTARLRRVHQTRRSIG